MSRRPVAYCGLAAFFAALSAASAQAPAAVFPNTLDGKPLMQLGLDGFAYWTMEDQFLNLLRKSDYAWTATRGWPDGTTMSAEAMVLAGHIDAETMVPTSIPETFDQVRSGLFRAGARTHPLYYAGTYVFDWEGEAQARCGFGVKTRVVSAQRIECDYAPSEAAWSNVELTKIGPGFKNPRLFRKENEAAIEAGEVFDPKWLAYVGRYKILRTMDIQNSNISWTRSVEELPSKNVLAWGSTDTWSASARAAGVKRGVPIEVLFDLAVAADTALWMHVAGIIGAPEVFIDEAAMKNLSDWKTGQPWIRAKAKENAQEIINSPEWRKYADEIVRSMIASGYKADRTLYVELWNEVWNTANPWWRMTYYNAGIADGIGGSQGLPYRYGYGYMTAMFAVQLDAALKAKSRAGQPFVLVLAGQNANPATTADALKGFKRYFADKGIDPAPFLARLGVSTQSYYGGTFEERALDAVVGGSAADGDHKTRWLAAIAAEPQALARRAADTIIDGPAQRAGSLKWIAALRAQHQRHAEDAGAFFLGDYEGESHDAAPSWFDAEPAGRAWLVSFRYGPEGERLTRAWVEALLAQNPKAAISNYQSIGLPAAVKPWVDGPPGEENGRTRALEPYLRPSPQHH